MRVCIHLRRLLESLLDLETNLKHLISSYKYTDIKIKCKECQIELIPYINKINSKIEFNIELKTEDLKINNDKTQFQKNIANLKTSGILEADSGFEKIFLQDISSREIPTLELFNVDDLINELNE